MHRAVVIALALVACGRVGFDGGSSSDAMSHPTTDSSSPSGDGAPPIDAPGTMMIDSSMMMPDTAMVNACANAMIVLAGQRLLTNTCDQDMVDACAGPATQEVLFVFTPTTTKSYNIAAYDPGTQNVMNSTVRLNNSCTATMGSCAAINGTTLTAGTMYYFAVEASSGGCTNIEFSIN